MCFAFVMLGFSFRLGITFAVLPRDGLLEIIMCYVLVLILFVADVLSLYPLIPLTRSFFEPLRWYAKRIIPGLRRA